MEKPLVVFEKPTYEEVVELVEIFGYERVKNLIVTDADDSAIITAQCSYESRLMGL